MVMLQQHAPVGIIIIWSVFGLCWCRPLARQGDQDEHKDYRGCYGSRYVGVHASMATPFVCHGKIHHFVVHTSITKIYGYIPISTPASRLGIPVYKRLLIQALPKLNGDGWLTRVRASPAYHGPEQRHSMLRSMVGWRDWNQRHTRDRVGTTAHGGHH